MGLEFEGMSYDNDMKDNINRKSSFYIALKETEVKGHV